MRYMRAHLEPVKTACCQKCNLYEKNMLEIVSTFVKTDVTCVKCLENYIFAGIGGNLHVFDSNGSLLQIYNVFPSQRIYGIVPNRNVIAVYGSNRIKIIDFVNARVTKDLISKESEDWILDLKWITGVDESPNVVTVLAHNYISLWTPHDMISVKKIACDERCLLYSALIVNDAWSELLICSGTVYSEILIWKPSERPYFCPVLYRLVGHDGVIFSINYEKRLNLIVTTSDDRTLRFWSASFRKKRIAPIRTIYGHSARVFKSLIIGDFIATAGEDSVINVWNLDGGFVRKFDAHQNGVVWSMDSAGGRLVSGGGDAGVSVYPFRSDSSESELVFDGESPKVLKLLSHGLALVNESGVLKYYCKEWTIVGVHNELKSYCVMDVSENRNLLALGGFHGHIFVYEYVTDRLVLRCSTISKNRIFSIHWLNDNVLLTSEIEGKLRTWECGIDVGGEDIWFLKLTEEFLLPPSKERWATTAVLLNNGRFAVGDRKGNIHLYEPGTVDPIQTIKKAHNHLGITNLYFEENNLISIGRNGIVKRFSLTDTLTQTTHDKLPFTWLCRVLHHQQTTLILGFSGSNFVIWDHNARRILHEINCGGGHRSWDFHIDSNLVDFVYIKEKTIQRYRCTWESMAVVNVVEGYHTKEINVVVTIPVGNGKVVMVSGGEDTTLRLGVRNVDDYGSEFRYSMILKSHLSSVRCIEVHRLSCDEFLLISGGGRAQIIVWRLDLHDSPYRINEMFNYYAPGAESETRVMDMTVVCKNDCNVLIAACSDGSLQFFNIDAECKLECLGTVSYASKCLMKVEYVSVSGRDVVVSTSTDGKIVFWDITDRKYENVKPFFSLPVHQSGVNSFSYKKLENDSFLFATGGDDNAIVINILKIEYVDAFNVSVIKTYENSQCHCAQVTGMEILGSYIVTTSIDQNVTVLKYDCDGTDLNVQVVRSYSSVIADIQGMSCYKTGRNVYACLYGKGIEVIKLFL